MVMLIVAGLVFFTLFLPFIILAGRSGQKEVRSIARLISVRGKNELTTANRPPEILLKDVPVSDAATLGSRLGLSSVQRALQDLLAKSACRLNQNQLLCVCLSVQLITSFAGRAVTGRWWAALLLGLGAGVLPGWLLVLRARRRAKSMDAVLPLVADTLSRAMRAGQSLPMAMNILAEQAPEPAKTEFLEVCHQQKFGVSLNEALSDLVKRVPSQELKLLVTGISIQRDTGGNLTQVLERLSAVMRERMKIEGEIQSQTAQGRLTGWILCLLPLLLLLAMHLLNPSYLQVFLKDPLGRACVWGSLILLACGAIIRKHLISRIEI